MEQIGTDHGSHPLSLSIAGGKEVAELAWEEGRGGIYVRSDCIYDD